MIKEAREIEIIDLCNEVERLNTEVERLQKQPKINTRCPACGRQTLFIGEGGWLTCGAIPGPDGKGGCPNPTLINRITEAHPKRKG